jgi:hypothetical protein
MRIGEGLMCICVYKPVSFSFLVSHLLYRVSIPPVSVHPGFYCVIFLWFTMEKWEKTL